MKVLVTGANGFIARHVMDELMRCGHTVIGTDLAGPKKGMVSFDKWIKADLTQAKDARRAVLDSKCSAVCHLAAEGDVYKAEENPPRAFFLGSVMTAVLLEAVATNCGIPAHFVYASTWETYGPPLYTPFDELHPQRPESFYAAAKLGGEQAVRLYGLHCGVPTTILRLGSAFAGTMRESSVFSIFKRLAKEGKPLVVFGDGKQFRQWTHVGDIAKAFEVTIRRKDASMGETFNVVSPTKVTVKQIANMIAKKHGTEITYAPAKPGEVSPVAVTSGKISTVLGWKAEVKTLAALRRML